MLQPYNTNLPPELRSLKEEIEGHARAYGLDFYETIQGAQFVFLDGHTAWFINTAYWNSKNNKCITNNPKLVWCP